MAILPKILRGPRAPRGQGSSIEDASTSATASVEPVVVAPGWSVEPAATAAPSSRRDADESESDDVGVMPTLDRTSSRGPRAAPWQPAASSRGDASSISTGETDGLIGNTSASQDGQLPQQRHTDREATSPSAGYFSQPPSASNQRGFAALRTSDDSDDDDDDDHTQGRGDIEMLRQSASQERLSYEQAAQRGYADGSDSTQRPQRYSEKSYASGTTSFSVYQKGEGLAVSNLAPPPADKAQLRRNLMRVVEGLSIIIGGWATLIFAMYLFKALAVKYNLAASDRTAEWVFKHQQSSTQLFTLAGVLLSEICFILWESSIVYFAVRRLAHGRERTEVLTYVGFNELKRAGYTLSGRRKQWPLITLAVWLGSSFLAPAFTVWLTPSPMTHRHAVSWPELDLLSVSWTNYTTYPVTDPLTYEITNITQAGEACRPDVYLTAQTVQVLKSGQQVKLDGCPEYSNANNLISAGIVKLQAAQNETNALLKVGNSTFLGGTGGVMPIGPQGLIPSGAWAKIPSGVRTPEGYDYIYELEQQGMSVEVNCTRPRADTLPLITSQWTNTFGVANVTFLCPVTLDNFYTSILGFFSAQSVTANVCTSLKSAPASTNVSDVVTSMDLSYSTVSLWDFNAEATPLPLNASWIQNRPVSTLSTGQSITSIGGAASCAVRPYFARFNVVYNSTANYFTSTEIPGTREYTAGKNGELWDSRIVNNTNYAGAEAVSSRFLSFIPGIQAVSHVFRASNTIAGLDSDPNLAANDANLTPSNTRPFGANGAVAAMGEYLIGRHNSTEIALTDIEIFMQGVFEYVQTLKRLRYTFDLTSWQDEFEAEELKSTHVAQGTWKASTVGWGAGTITGDDSTQIVYISLIPIVLFALMSWGIVAWSHYYDRPHGVAYVAECDPTDLTDCIIAASQGGLQGSFHRQALLKKDGGLKGARKVRIRLGQIYRKGEADGLPQLGFVDVD